MNPFLTGLSLGSAFRLALPREAMRGLGGARAGAAAGSSLDFLDYREYHPGDDLRRLDWGVLARTDREVVKLYREEVFPRLDLVLDASRSMDLPGTRKADAARLLCGALAAAAAGAGCTAALWLAGGRVRRLPGADPATWPELRFEERLPPCEGFLRDRPAFPRAGVRVLLSDLLWPEEPDAVLAPLCDGAATVWVLQPLAAEEESPSAPGPCRLVDAESGEALDAILDPGALASYRAALAAHRARWQDACRRHGATLLSLSVPPPDAAAQPADALAPLLRHGLLEPL